MINYTDPIWKGILEDCFEDFLCFMSPDARELIDFGRGVYFMDKEFQQLFPQNKNPRLREADKLAKVYLYDGSEEYVLIHVEVQQDYGKDFSERMFSYYAKIWDKYRKPISAYAIFTERFLVQRTDTYTQQFLGTKLSYTFNTYKISTQDRDELLSSENPFALVVLIARAAIDTYDMPKDISRDEALLGMKNQILKALIGRGFANDKIRSIMNFLRWYVRFETTEINNIFEEQISSITKGTDTMGIEEQLKEIFRQEGKAEGIAEGIAEGKKLGIDKAMELVAKRLKLKGDSVTKIAEVTGLSVKEIEAL
jgi:hypothetical protein